MKSTMKTHEYIAEIERLDGEWQDLPPWILCTRMHDIIHEFLNTLDSEYIRNGDVAVHRSAQIEEGVIIKGPAIIGKNCFIAAFNYLRDGIFLGDGVTIGPHCEIKASFIFSHSTLAHLNYVGNSLIGSSVNLEAGVVLANHWNERENKDIAVCIEGHIQQTGVTKFGALLGDDTNVGANAVLSPGTMLPKHSIVPRLTSVNQFKVPIAIQTPLPAAAIPLRPHHILDILRNYGHDRPFTPHPYGHALHTVARQLLENRKTMIQLVSDADAICAPCQYLQPDNMCRDTLPQLAHPLSKQVYNDTLDLRLFAYFGVAPGSILTFRTFLELVNARVPGLEMLCTHPQESVQFRLDGLLQGLQKLGMRT